MSLTLFTDAIRFKEMTIAERDALANIWGLMILNGDLDRAEMKLRDGTWSGLLTNSDHIDEYDAMIDALYGGSNELIFQTLISAIDADNISIFIKEMLDTAAITIASGDKVQRIQGKDADTVTVPVDITCNKTDVTFEQLRFSSNNLTLNGGGDLATDCFFTGSTVVTLTASFVAATKCRFIAPSATPCVIDFGTVALRDSRFEQASAGASYLSINLSVDQTQIEVSGNRFDDSTSNLTDYAVKSESTSNDIEISIFRDNIFNNCDEGAMNIFGHSNAISGNTFFVPTTQTASKRALLLNSDQDVNTVVANNVFFTTSATRVHFEYSGADANGQGLVLDSNVFVAGEVLLSQDATLTGNFFSSDTTVDFQSKTGIVVIGGDMTGATLQNIPADLVFRNVKGQDDRGDYIPVDGTVDLGSDTKRFAELWLSSNADIEGNLQLDGNATIDGTLASGAQTVAGHLLPSADDTYNLGSLTNEWRDGHFDGTLNADQLALGTGATQGLLTDLIPTVDSLRTLGSASLRFVNIFLDGLDVAGNIVVSGTVDGVDIAARDHAASHTVASHSDTTGTGAELETLTDGSDAGTLHLHQATNVTFAEAVSADWDGGTDPGDVDDALDQLAERTKDLETVSEWLPVVMHVDATQVRVENYPIVTMTDTEKTEFSWAVPESWVSTTEVLLVMIPDTTETITMDFAIASTAEGEAVTANVATNDNQTFSATSGQIDEWNITSFLPTLAAGDYLGVRMDSDTPNIRVLGLRITYVRT